MQAKYPRIKCRPMYIWLETLKVFKSILKYIFWVAWRMNHISQQANLS